MENETKKPAEQPSPSTTPATDSRSASEIWMAEAQIVPSDESAS
jgi:hypothetical protein